MNKIECDKCREKCGMSGQKGIFYIPVDDYNLLICTECLEQLPFQHPVKLYYYSIQRDGKDTVHTRPQADDKVLLLCG